MMDGRNCSGRKISLLNDSSGTAPTSTKFPPLLAEHSRTTSCSSTPSLEPRTPQLCRSDSSDSQVLGSPSPVTPSFGHFDNISHSTTHKRQPPFYIINPVYGRMDDQGNSMYPPIPDSAGAMPTAYPMPPALPQQMAPQSNQQLYRSSNSPASEPSRVSNASGASNAKAAQQPKKNQYPCPMAKQIGCTDFFTTSGHAARHAKKHTGKKDAFCPECNKAFTRKDNMEQHRRTHQNGRGATKSSDDSRVKKPARQPAKKPTVKSEPQLEAAINQQLEDQQQAQVQQQVDQALMMPPSGPYFLNGMDTGPVPPLPMPMGDFGGRPPLHRNSYTNTLEYIPPAPNMIADPDMHYSYPSPGLSNGLNSLALAASEHRRRSHEEMHSSSGSESSQETP